jgi:hypothetical protein
MSKPGQALENYNRDLVKLISEFKKKSTSIATTIEMTEKEKERVEGELERLTTKLGELTTKLDVQRELKTTTDETIKKTEYTYMQILENSLDLLTSLKEEKEQ